jgi:DNA polymerase I-like protein with 3'-5' exonuclease and polymerase domains
VQWGKYNILNNAEKIKAVDSYLIDPSGKPNFPIISYDTETNGLLLYKTSIIGFSFAVNKHQGFYLPILSWVPDPASFKTRTIDKVKYESFMEGRLQNIWTGKFHDEFVKPHEVDFPDFIPMFLERWFKQSQLFMWNAPFDINHTFINFGVDLRNNLASDGGLLVHIKNENESVGLKESAVVYKDQLGINPFAHADQEKRELKGSIIANGGKSREVWRADPTILAKYAIADTFLTHGLTEVVLKELYREHQEKYGEIEKWIFENEVMPLCKEVVVNMKRKGVYIDVPHFEKISSENKTKLLQLEDEFMKSIEPFLEGFEKGKSMDEAVSNQRLIKRIIELEGLPTPQLIDKKTGESKDSLSKAVVKKEYEKNPHWLWGYILGEDEIKYSAEKLNSLKAQLYEEVEGRRYRFNLGSNDHLIWLFFDKLREDRKQFPKTDTSTVEDWKPSLDADSIRQILLPKYPWVISLLKYKKLQKIQSTYVEPALEYQIGGWLYMDMKQNGTTSGRFSCSGGYNLQTLPRVDDELEALNECHKCEAKAYDKKGNLTGLISWEEPIEVMANRVCHQCGHVESDIVKPSTIKKGFIAPPGYKIINADYASLEPRCFAYVSGEENIKAVYKEGLDLYSKVYCDIFDKAGEYSAHPDAPNFLKKVNKKARSWIKPLVLGIPYGAGDAQVANMTGNMVKYIDIDGVEKERPNMDEGKRIRDLYLSTYPQLQGYMNLQEYMAIQYGFVDSKFGRRRHFIWAKTVGDFFEEKPCVNHLQLDRIDKVTAFIQTSSKKLTGVDCQIKDIRTGNFVFNLTELDLRELVKRLGMSMDPNPMKGIKEGVRQKGGWKYIRSIIKADLNNAKNHPIQALAGHIANMGMLVTQRSFEAEGLDAWVALQVHDELMCYAREDQAERAKQLLQAGMEDNMYTQPLKNDVVMIAEPVICDNLKDSK